MDIYASDDEKAEQIKQWWRDNGVSVLIGIVIGVAAIFGWRFWQSYQHSQAEQAQAIYHQAMSLESNGKHKQASDETQKLLSKYASTPYAVFAAIEMASDDVTAGDESSAKTYLEWVVKHAKEAGHVALARLRLGQLLLNEKNYDQALAICEQAKLDSYKSLFAELRGDVYAAKGDKAEALLAYQTAMLGVAPGQPRQMLLKMKADDVAVPNES